MFLYDECKKAQFCRIFCTLCDQIYDGLTGYVNI